VKIERKNISMPSILEEQQQQKPNKNKKDEGRVSL
jgi:hypothetical protein